MSKIRALVIVTALAAVSLMTPAAAQAGSSHSSISVNGWRWHD